jgi:hypothetical protein
MNRNILINIMKKVRFIHLKINIFNVITQNKLLSVFGIVLLFVQQVQVAPISGQADFP